MSEINNNFDSDETQQNTPDPTGEVIVPPAPAASATTPEEAPRRRGSGNRVFLVAVAVLGTIFLVSLLLMGAYLFLLRPQASALAEHARATQTAMVITQDAAMNSTGTPVTAPLALATTKPQAGQATGQPKDANPPASTSVPASSTPVIAVAAATQTPAGLSRTATVAALLTQAATKQQGQPVQPTATLRPTNTPTKALAQVATATSTRSVTGALTAVPTATQSAPTATATQATGGSGGQLSATQTALPTATLAATPTALPQTGLADQAGIPGMFGIALALIVVIFLARRLRTA